MSTVHLARHRYRQVLDWATQSDFHTVAAIVLIVQLALALNVLLVRL